MLGILLEEDLQEPTDLPTVSSRRGGIMSLEVMTEYELGALAPRQRALLRGPAAELNMSSPSASK